MSTRVCLLKLSRDGRGGLEKTAEQIAAAFVKAGCQTTWITGRGRGFLGLLRFDQATRRYCFTHPHDIVLGFDRTTCQTHLRAGNGCHRAWLELRQASALRRLSFALNPLHRTILYLEKRAFESPDLQLLITNSHLVKEQILRYYKVQAPIEVVHNGVDWDSYESVFSSFTAHSTPTLLFAGHGYERKGLFTLLKALRHVPARLLVVGRERKLKRFQEAAKGLDVHFLGPQPSLIPYMQQADAMIIPSLYDPFANVTVEALAMGLFVVSSKMNGGHEVLTPQTGRVFTDHDCLVQALQHIPLKTKASARAIRDSVRHLSDPSPKIVQLCLHTASSPALR